ncbi:MAG: response regulator, partial [Desulfobacteraceae bacterium]|nr:response regulator [Desulfobacteraceae bacterium]
LIHDEIGRVIGTLSTGIDVTDRKQARDAMLESEKRYKNLYENAQVGLGRTRISDGKVLECNSKMAQIFGYSKKSEFISNYVLSEHYVDKNLRKIFLAESENKGIITNKEAEFQNRDGKTIWVRFDTRIYPEKGYMEDVIIDITDQKNAEKERRKLEAQLHQAQKMEAIGTLAGGIAHNFNNILMGIQGRTSLMMLDKNLSHPDFEHMKGIEEYVKSAVELTKDILGFARGGRYEVKPTDLNELIKHENRIFGRTKKEVKVCGKYEEVLWTVEVDRGQIQQALMNLYVNAWQAMPKGGELYVQTENVVLDEASVKPFRLSAGKYVKISVMDTGVGMDSSILDKIFDPFFTTKEAGQGTGLGLASVYGVVKSHSGFITVYSEKGEGTTFNIFLPASEKGLIEEYHESEYDKIWYGKGTVLLVDDESMIIEVAQKMLARLGYSVLIAQSGKQALEVYEKNIYEIDLVILDMIMPGMRGGETYDRLKEIDENIRVILSSGYSINGKAKEIIDRGCSGFIQKPFSLSDLSIKIKKVLDGTKR